MSAWSDIVPVTTRPPRTSAILALLLCVACGYSGTPAPRVDGTHTPDPVLLALEARKSRILFRPGRYVQTQSEIDEWKVPVLRAVRAVIRRGHRVVIIGRGSNHQIASSRAVFIKRTLQRFDVPGTALVLKATTDPGRCRCIAWDILPATP